MLQKLLQMIKCSGFHIAPLKIEDARSLTQMMQRNSDSFSSYFPLTLAATNTEEKAINFILDISQKTKLKEVFLFGLFIEKEVVGLVYIKDINWSIEEGEFAYCIGKKYSGNGWITEAVNILSSLAFIELGFERLKIIVYKANMPSVRVAEKCGFTFIETLENEYTPPGGEPMDMELYLLKK